MLLFEDMPLRSSRSRGGELRCTSVVWGWRWTKPCLSLAAEHKLLADAEGAALGQRKMNRCTGGGAAENSSGRERGYMRSDATGHGG